MDIDNDDIGYLVKLSLPSGKGSAIVNSVDQMVKRKAKSRVPLSKGPYVYIAKERGIGCKAAKFT